MSIDRNNWQLVKLGDLVQSIKDTVNIDDCGLEHYLGGEHFNTNDLHVNGRGIIEGSTIGPAFTMRFQPGHVLLVSRNPHLRKMAVADFTGVCSNVTYVCETKSDSLLQEFLPFVMKSSDFWNFAEANKRGSTNFYLNWSDFARYEFLLPPINEQKRIAEVLWAADEVVQKYEEMRKTLDDLKTILVKTFVGNYSNAESYMGNIIEVCQYGLSSALLANGDFPVLRMMNLIDGKVVANDLKYINMSPDEFNKYKLFKNDILFNRTNSADLVGKTAIFALDGDYVFASYLVRIRAKSDVILPEILNYILNLDEYQNKVRAFMSYGVSQANINASNLKKVKIPIMPIDKQEELLNKLCAIEESVVNTTDAYESAKALLSNQLNQYLGGAN